MWCRHHSRYVKNQQLLPNKQTNVPRAISFLCKCSLFLHHRHNCQFGHYRRTHNKLDRYIIEKNYDKQHLWIHFYSLSENSIVSRSVSSFGQQNKFCLLLFYSASACLRWGRLTSRTHTCTVSLVSSHHVTDVTGHGTGRRLRWKFQVHEKGSYLLLPLHQRDWISAKLPLPGFPRQSMPHEYTQRRSITLAFSDLNRCQFRRPDNRRSAFLDVYVCAKMFTV